MSLPERVVRMETTGADRPPIDVKELIARLTDNDLLESADGYFRELTPGSEQCFKPFSNAADAIHITRNLSLLFEAAQLFKGADVVDFGCATGWLTLALADLGCAVVGVDISPSALALARTAQAARQLQAPGSASFAPYDGHLLPLPDASVDRVVCFDAFHHVRDQAWTLSEFARVLRPGGRVAMLEPGPNHSKTPQSQAEMARYNVIENDVVMANVATLGGHVGFGEPQMLVQLPSPVVIGLEEFSTWATQGGAKQPGFDNMTAMLDRHLTDTQCFFMCKQGTERYDSRRPEGLASAIRLVSVSVDAQAGLRHFQIAVRNTGKATWVVAAGSIGEVTLGCQRIGADGAVVQADFLRFPVAATEVDPGAEVQVSAAIPLSANESAGFRFELVAERLCWFSQVKSDQFVNWQP
jgi:SAM-dependent methyltransferase